MIQKTDLIHIFFNPSNEVKWWVSTSSFHNPCPDLTNQGIFTALLMGRGDVQTSFPPKSLSMQPTSLSWDTELRAGCRVAKPHICTRGKILSPPMQKMKVRPQKYLLCSSDTRCCQLFQWLQLIYKFKYQASTACSSMTNHVWYQSQPSCCEVSSVKS